MAYVQKWKKDLMVLFLIMKVIVPKGIPYGSDLKRIGLNVGQMFLKLYKKCGILLIGEQMFGMKFFCRFNLIIY